MYLVGRRDGVPTPRFVFYTRYLLLVLDFGFDDCLQVSLEMAVRVLTVALHWCTPLKRHGYMRSIEKSAALLTSRGHITGVEVRSRLTRLTKIHLLRP